MRESRTYGSVRGAPSNGRPYRDPGQAWTSPAMTKEGPASTGQALGQAQQAPSPGIIDLLCQSDRMRVGWARVPVHHVAFRAQDEAEQLTWREAVLSLAFLTSRPCCNGNTHRARERYREPDRPEYAGRRRHSRERRGCRRNDRNNRAARRDPGRKRRPGRCRSQGPACCCQSRPQWTGRDTVLEFRSLLARAHRAGQGRLEGWPVRRGAG